MTDITRKQMAVELAVSERTLRRYLPRIHGLQCNRVGRLITFAPADVAMIREAMRGGYNTGLSETGRRMVASAPVRKLSSSAQERTRELIRRQLGPRAKRKPVAATEPAP
jgi:hypothetical protein